MVGVNSPGDAIWRQVSPHLVGMVGWDMGADPVSFVSDRARAICAMITIGSLENH